MFHKHISVYLLRKHDSNALTQYLIAPTKNVIGILYGRARSGLSGRAITGGGGGVGGKREKIFEDP